MSMREAGAGTRGYSTFQTRREQRENNSRKAYENEKSNKKLQQRIKKLERQAKAAPAAAKPKPKPATPESKSQKIEPVKASPEIAQAKSYAQAYEKKDYSSIFKQDETDYTAKFNPSGKSDNSGGPQKDPQAFADKYKFEAAQSNKQMDTTSDKPMTGADILKKDKQQYGDYM